MTEKERKKNTNLGNNNNNHKSIFKIMDRIMKEVNKSKKIFMFMFFSMMILPVTTIIVFIYTFDNPTYDRKEFRENIKEYDLVAQRLNNYLAELENLPQDQKGKKLEIILNSVEYKKTKDELNALSQTEIKNIISDTKNTLYKKEIRIITFILSIIWIALGIRQYIVLSSWSKKYNNFKKEQEEIDKRLDMD